MAEWLKAHAWKACKRETVSRVRIPLSPPLFNDLAQPEIYNKMIWSPYGRQQMKKFFIIIILSLLISEISYAKAVKLNCSFKDAYDSMSDGSVRKLSSNNENYHIISQDTVVTIDEARKFFAGGKADRFDDEIIKITWVEDLKGPKGTIKLKKSWKLNRITGVLVKDVYSKVVGRDSSYGSPFTLRYDCRVAKKKF